MPRSTTWSALQNMSASTRCAIILRDGSTCCWCARLLGRAEIQIDHVRPRSRGGSHGPENLVTSCAGCNAARSEGVAAIRERLADVDRTIADGTTEAKRRARLPLPRAEGRALAREWYPGRAEYLSKRQRATLRAEQEAA